MLDKFKEKSKYGFSLFEMVVTMAIAAIFIAACSNVFTQKHKAKITRPIHGRYECYRNASGILRERLFNEENMAYDKKAENNICTFKPPAYAAYVVISAVAAGGHGGALTGGSAGEYVNMFLSTTNHEFSMTPGISPSNSNSPGGDTIIWDNGVDGKGTPKILKTLKGGESDSAKSIGFSNCTTNGVPKYICGKDLSCTINNKERYIQVEYCKQAGSGLVDLEDSLSRTITIEFDKDDHIQDRYFEDYCNEAHSSSQNKIIKGLCTNGECTSNTGIVAYDYTRYICPQDKPNNPVKTTYFNLNLTLKGNYSKNRQESPLNFYINGLGIAGGSGNADGIATYREGCTEYKEEGTQFTKNQTTTCRVSTGNGGASNKAKNGEKGGHGAVLISW